MKKTILLTTLFLAVVACQKTPAEQAPETDGNGFVEKTFTATIVDVDPETRAITDGIKTSWVKGDKLSVSNSTPGDKVLPENAGVLTADADGASTTFTGNVQEGLDKYCAVYPYSSVTNWNNSGTAGGYNAASGTIKGADDNRQIMQVVNTVEGVNIFMDPQCMYLAGTAAADLNFKFKHVLAYIKFTVPESNTAKIKRIEIWDSVEKDGTEAHKIHGTFNMNGNSNWVVNSIGSTKANILRAVNSDNSSLQPGVYYIAVLPRTNYSGLNVKFINPDENPNKTKTFFKKGTVKLESGKVYNMGVLPDMSADLGTIPAE